MSNCKPGDLAIVVKAYNACNVGTIVKVLRPNNDQAALYTPGADIIWLAEAAHLLTYDYGGVLKRERTGPVPDSYLRPIRGNPKNEERLTESRKDDSLTALSTARRTETERQTCEN
jgi:hypothetical protein